MAMKETFNKFINFFTPSKHMHASVFSCNLDVTYETVVAIGSVPAGTKLAKTNNGYYVLANTIVFNETEVLNTALFKKVLDVSESAIEEIEQAIAESEAVGTIDEEPTFNIANVIDSEAGNKLDTAVANQKAIADGEKYFFYHVGEKRWAKATMERTSSDLGRLRAGFALPITTTVNSKLNRLTTLNVAYGLGLEKEEIKEIANA